VASALGTNIARALKASRKVVEIALAALAAGGTCLLEDVPGVGQDPWRRRWPRSLDLSFAACSSPATCFGRHHRRLRLRPGRAASSSKPGPLFANLSSPTRFNRHDAADPELPPGSDGEARSPSTERRARSGAVHGSRHPEPARAAGTYPLPNPNSIGSSCGFLGYPSYVERELLLRRRNAGRAHAPASRRAALEVRRPCRPRSRWWPWPRARDTTSRIVAATRSTPLISLGPPAWGHRPARVARARALLRGRGMSSLTT